MIIRGNTVSTTMPRTNYEQTDPAKADYLRGKAVLDQKIADAQTAADNAKTEAKTEAKTYTDSAVKKAAPRNRLDNSDFTNPVNQRGQTSYANTGYTIDRWRVNAGKYKVEIVSGGIKLTNNDTERRYLEQIINRPDLIGKTLTVVVEHTDGTVRFGTAKVHDNASTSANVAYTFGTNSYVGVVNWNGTPAVWIALGSTESTTIKNIAIYEGEYTAETLPEYQPKGYGAELAECQRYYYQSWTGATIGANGILLKEAFTSARLISVDLPCEMRVTPTISICKTDGTANAVSEYVTSTTVTNVSVVYANNKSFIPAQQSSGFTAGKVYSLHYTASADL